MHGPTFMANPLACAVALRSTQLLVEQDWQSNIQRIEKILVEQLSDLAELDHVADVRVLGAIGVVELTSSVDMKSLQQQFVERGIWVRPFGKLVYVMPPYVITDDELNYLLVQMSEVVKNMRGVQANVLA
jgi:adenosylmethionine-8-amino-7-oxononanoate aminotransferase